MSKSLAFFTHLGISAFVALAMIFIVFVVWYPSPLYKAVGVTEIFLIIIAVDVIIGPLITLVVFKKGKKTLKFDLSVIAAVQLAALIYGAHTVFVGRPAFLVFAKDRFEVVSPTEWDAQSALTAKQANNLAAAQSVFQPKWVAAVESNDPERRKDILFAAATGGPDWPQLPELYVPLEKVQPEIIKRAKSLADLKPLNVGKEAEIDALAGQFGAQAKWVPLKAPALDMVVLVNGETAKVLKMVDLRPW
ncbi:MAG: TfpX/TfpZ family type IV pilin accessory protein [Burkholderiaceae bacterium]